MAKRKKHAEHVNHERWLVSYADFITLLFAFFVVMFAASNTDEKKAGKVAKAVEVAFTELAIFDPSAKVVPLFSDGGLPGDRQQIIGNTDGGFELDVSQVVQKTSNGGTGERREMEAVREHFEQVLREQIESKQVQVSVDDRGVTVSLNESGFFAPGSAMLEPRSLAAIARIADTLKAAGNHVRIEGHTDDRPIATAQFPSNWELSTSRATNVLRFLITNAGLKPSRLSAVGYGEHRPLARNDSPEGRARNRRVDIVIMSGLAQREEPRAPGAAAHTPPPAPAKPDEPPSQAKTAEKH